MIRIATRACRPTNSVRARRVGAGRPLLAPPQDASLTFCSPHAAWRLAVMTFALLAKGMDSEEAQLEAIFCMFDSDQDAVLTRAEFEEMVQTTVNLNLHTLLVSNKGAAVFEEQLQMEFSDENLAFWQGVKAFKGLDDVEARAAKARELEDTFIDDGAPRQVNLPGTIRAPLRELLKASRQPDSEPLPLTAFDAASEEIFKLMERDTFARFKNDPDALRTLVDAYYSSVAAAEGATDAEKASNSVSFETFKLWATSEPSVSILFSGLSASVNAVLKQRSNAEEATEVVATQEAVAHSC